MKIILSIGVILIVMSCTMNPQEKIHHNKFKELHNHQESQNYEIVEIVPNAAKVSDFYGHTESPKIAIDTLSKTIMAGAYGIKESAHQISGTYITDLFGNILKRKHVLGRVLKDGTIWEAKSYSNWFINSDSTKHKYIDPFSNQKIDNPFEFIAKEKDPEKWLSKFKEIYIKAQYIYMFGMSKYYFKIDNKCYFMNANLEDLPDDLKQQYPAKEDQDVRMVELKDMSPKYFVPPNERDTQLIREIDYVETLYKKENWGLIDVGYSAGWWYLEIYMPLGDTIKIKRYASFESPDIQLYKIPNAYGGRQDVLFIVQEPKDIHTAQVGGMYVIRPRDPEQPQRRFKSIVYNKNENGERVIDQEKSVETEAYKAWKTKQKK